MPNIDLNGALKSQARNIVFYRFDNGTFTVRMAVFAGEEEITDPDLKRQLLDFYHNERIDAEELFLKIIENKIGDNRIEYKVLTHLPEIKLSCKINSLFSPWLLYNGQDIRCKEGMCPDAYDEWLIKFKAFKEYNMNGIVFIPIVEKLYYCYLLSMLSMASTDFPTLSFKQINLEGRTCDQGPDCVDCVEMRDRMCFFLRNSALHVWIKYLGTPKNAAIQITAINPNYINGILQYRDGTFEETIEVNIHSDGNKVKMQNPDRQDLPVVEYTPNKHFSSHPTVYMCISYNGKKYYVPYVGLEPICPGRLAHYCK